MFANFMIGTICLCIGSIPWLVSACQDHRRMNMAHNDRKQREQSAPFDKAIGVRLVPFLRISAQKIPIRIDVAQSQNRTEGHVILMSTKDGEQAIELRVLEGRILR